VRDGKQPIVAAMVSATPRAATRLGWQGKIRRLTPRLDVLTHSSEDWFAMDNAADTTAQLIEVGRRFDARNWVLGTSGNFSVVTSRAPLRLLMTRSGMAKGGLRADGFVEIDAAGTVIQPAAGRPSAEALLHVEIARARGAGAVLHTHSIWSTLLSEWYGPAGGLAIAGYEMLKGLEGIATHEHREWVPILENDQDMPRLADRVRGLLTAEPHIHAFLLRRHGLYTWGESISQAVRHVEILEFLLEAVARTDSKGGASWLS
jgi:methylthioribulose-1-phosphate dehydratase